jgi:nicotinamidase-related amidase
MRTADNNTTALLVIDVQHALFVQKSPIRNADHLLNTINTLIDRTHAAAVPVVFFQHINKGILKRDAPGWELHPDLHISEADTFMEKHHGSAFQDTILDDWLQSRGISTVIMCGLTTHGCIKATCKDALRRDYHAIVAADAHSSYHADAASLIDHWNTTFSGMGAAVACADAIVPDMIRSYR